MKLTQRQREKIKRCQSDAASEMYGEPDTSNVAEALRDLCKALLEEEEDAEDTDITAMCC